MSEHLEADTRKFVIYPMVEEQEATGRVAVVYQAILDRLPMVPSLFKSLAVCPPYLQLAWSQVEGVMAEADFDVAASELADACAEAARPHPDPATSDALGGFVNPLARMTLVAAGLVLALEGRIDAPLATPLTARAGFDPSAGQLQGAVPAAWKVDAAEVFGEIRHRLRTPIINSIWRALAGEGRLDDAWRHLAPQIPNTTGPAATVQADALERAGTLPWRTAASPEALEAAGVTDAMPGMRRILDGYLFTLPRVLALVAANHG